MSEEMEKRKWRGNEWMRKDDDDEKRKIASVTKETRANYELSK